MPSIAEPAYRGNLKQSLRSFVLRGDTYTQLLCITRLS